jgi:hypothetical protein
LAIGAGEQCGLRGGGAAFEGCESSAWIGRIERKSNAEMVIGKNETQG